MKYNIFIITITLLPSLLIAQEKGTLILNIDSSRVQVEKYWQYHAIDSCNQEMLCLTDSGWLSIPSDISITTAQKVGWQNIGWFYIKISFNDTTLVNRPLGLQLIQAGASDIYINERYINSIGRVGCSSEEEKHAFTRRPMAITFSKKNNILAIKYSNHRWHEINNKNSLAGFSLYLNRLQPETLKWAKDIKKLTKNIYGTAAR